VLGGPAGAAVHGAVPSGPQPGVLDQMKDTARAFTNVSGLLGFGSGFAAGGTRPQLARPLPGIGRTFSRSARRLPAHASVATTSMR
jgi:hypothetical protein